MSLFTIEINKKNAIRENLSGFSIYICKCSLKILTKFQTLQRFNDVIEAITNKWFNSVILYFTVHRELIKTLEVCGIGIIIKPIT